MFWDGIWLQMISYKCKSSSYIPIWHQKRAIAVQHWYWLQRGECIWLLVICMYQHGWWASKFLTIPWLFGSRYASCLGYLQKLKPNLLLDVHLYNHVETLYEQIRHKALIQYTAPFISVDLHTMATSFKTSVAGLEKELAALIMENQIQVRQLRLSDLSLFKILLLHDLCSFEQGPTQWREFNLSDWYSNKGDI